MSLTPPANNSATGTLLIQTTAPAAASITMQSWQSVCAVCLLAGLLFTALNLRTARTPKKRLTGYLLPLLLCLGITSQMACSGGSNGIVLKGNGGTPPGSYSITITGTAGSLPLSEVLTITVN